MPVATEIVSLSKIYRQKNRPPVTVLEDISFSIPPGQVLGLLGANGAGKTTMLRIMAGLETPTSGRVMLNGYDLIGERDVAVEQVGAVLGCHGKQRRLTVWEHLMRCGPGSLAGQPVEVRAKHLLNEFDLWERRDDLLRNLSRGMRRRVAIACALITDPPILLVDEPTQDLDVPTARRVEAQIKRMALEKGTAVVLATRQPKVAQAWCDRVAVVRHGRLIADRLISELYDIAPGEYYQIRVQGMLDDRRSAWFDDLSLAVEGRDTILSGAVADQAALHGLLVKTRDLGLPLISVTRIEPGLEALLAHLM